MKLPYTTYDVFTTSRYMGNQLAIVHVPSAASASLTEEQKQAIATEFNYSETVFLHEHPDGSSGSSSSSLGPDTDRTVADYDIFGARIRIPFAGHPTIGTAVCLFAHQRAKFAQVSTLRTPLAGLVSVSYDPGTGVAGATVPHNLREHAKRLAHPAGTAEDGGEGATAPIVSIVKGMAFALAPLADLGALKGVSAGLVPASDVYRAEHLDKGDGWDAGVTGTLYYVDLTGPVDARMHGDIPDRVLRTRVFSRVEDPGTGSASSALCCYLAMREPREAGRVLKFHLVQGVEMGRRCDIYVTVMRTEDGKGVERVDLSGTAVKVMEGTLEI